MEVVGLTEDHRHPKTTDQILHNPRFQASFGPSEPSKIEVSFQSPSGLGWSGVEWGGVESSTSMDGVWDLVVGLTEDGWCVAVEGHQQFDSLWLLFWWLDCRWMVCGVL